MAPKDGPPPQVDIDRSVQQLFPTSDQLPPPKPTTEEGRKRWLIETVVNWIVLILALVNLTFVLFDATYLSARHHYLNWPYIGAVEITAVENRLKSEDRFTAKHWAILPDVVAFYDPIRGIEPHRVTDDYLRAARKAFKLMAATPDHPDTLAALEDMGKSSKAIIDKDPYQDQGLKGVQEQFKRAMKEHMGLDSTTKSFKQFWTPGHLTPAVLESERLWFEQTMTPLLTRNYFQTYDRKGNPDNVFWMIDIAFSIPILLEFLLRGVIGVRMGTYESFKAFFALRWYDAVYGLPLIIYWLPVVFQGPVHLLRCISVGYRMQRLGLINPVAIVQARIAKTLDIVTDLVNVKLLSNYQDSVRKMDMAKAMSAMPPPQRAQVERLIEKNLMMVVGRVLPDILPQLEQIITRAAYQALEQSPAYQQFKRLPGVGMLPEKLIPTIVAETLAGTQVSVLKAIGDSENVRLTSAMVDATVQSLLTHMAEFGTEAEIKALIIEALEEEKRKVLAD